MAAITTYHNKVVSSEIANDFGSGTATPVRMNHYKIKVDVQTAGDTLNASSVIDNNISSIVEMASSLGAPLSGTAIVASGTALTLFQTGTQWVNITAVMK